MTKAINYIEKLKEIILRDKAKNLIISNSVIKDIIFVKRFDICYFTCNCGEKYNKKIEAIIKTTGLFCRKCSAKNGYIRRKKTCMKSLGVSHPSKSDKIKKKKIETCIKNHGVKNPSQSKEIQDKKKETCMERYGFEYAIQNEKIHDKKKKTCLENNGVEHPSQNKEIRKKQKETCMEKYGVEFSLQNKEVRKKSIQTCLENYGVEYTFQSEKIKEKSKKTCLKKHGVEYPMQNKEIQEKGKKTCLKNHGVEYPSQNKKIFEKQQQKAFKQKKYIFKTKQEITCQGYEPRALKDLEKYHNYLHEDYQNWNDYIFWYEHNSKKHRYYPDIPFFKNNLIIEVKSNYTFYKEICKNLKKALSVLDKEIKFEFWVYNEKTIEFIIDTMQLKNKFKLMKQIKSNVII